MEGGRHGQAHPRGFAAGQLRCSRGQARQDMAVLVPIVVVGQRSKQIPERLRLALQLLACGCRHPAQQTHAYQRAQWVTDACWRKRLGQIEMQADPCAVLTQAAKAIDILLGHVAIDHDRCPIDLPTLKKIEDHLVVQSPEAKVVGNNHVLFYLGQTNTKICS